MARTFEVVLHFVRCVTVTVSPNQIIIIIIIIIERGNCDHRIGAIKAIFRHVTNFI